MRLELLPFERCLCWSKLWNEAAQLRVMSRRPFSYAMERSRKAMSRASRLRGRLSRKAAMALDAELDSLVKEALS